MDQTRGAACCHMDQPKKFSPIVDTSGVHKVGRGHAAHSEAELIREEQHRCCIGWWD